MAGFLRISVNVANALRSMKEIVKEIGDEQEFRLRQSAKFLEGEVKESIAGRRPPDLRSVDTGLFLNSVASHSLGPDTAVVYSLVPYAQYLEYGTVRIKARRHFGNTLDRNRDKVLNYMSEGVNAAVKKKNT